MLGIASSRAHLALLVRVISHPPTSITGTATSVTAAARPTRWVALSSGGAVAVSAFTNSSGVRKRSAGVVARALATARAMAGGTAGRTMRADDGGSSDFFAMIACGVDAVNGGSPASISYSTHPRL